MSKKIVDFISGIEINATPEELDSVQVFSKILVDDYKYPKSYIQTRPQYRVKIRPSDKKKEYPVDIAVFSEETKSEESCYIVVECKKKNINDGLDQLKDYLRFSNANLGVWFNGEEKSYIRKIEKNGKILFESIPNIPNFGERIEDIGKFKRKDLITTHNLKSTFKSIRNHLAANTVGATRDEVLAQQLINLIFCKIYDERFTEPNDQVNFRAGVDEDSKDVYERINKIFENVKRKYKAVIDTEDKISLDPDSLMFVVGELQRYCLIDVERDIISDAFETFIGHALKGGQGQFFTPRNVIRMMVEVLEPDADDLIIDPACGSGGFIVESLRYIWENLETEAKKLNWNEKDLLEEKMEVAINRIHGIDKDYFLTKVAKAYMAIIGDGKGSVFNEDSLDELSNWHQTTRSKISTDKFSVLLTNPPFGSKIPVRGENKLKQYELAHKWKLSKDSGVFEKGKIKEKEAPQTLFIERCLELLKENGRMAIVLPDGILGNENLSYIRNYIKNNSRIVGIVDIPKETFSPNTTTKTSILFLQKKLDENENYPIFMAIAKTCGHDRRGNVIDSDDIADISKNFKIWKKDNNFNWDK